jgi:hypothetical protein
MRWPGRCLQSAPSPMNCLYRLLACGDWQTRLKKEGDQVGWPIDKELVFTARVVEAEEAYRIGLLNHLVPREHPGAVNPTLSRRPHKARSGPRSGASIEQRSGNLQLDRCGAASRLPVMSRWRGPPSRGRHLSYGSPPHSGHCLGRSIDGKC